jgi:hypothetical protein
MAPVWLNLILQDEKEGEKERKRRGERGKEERRERGRIALV